MLSMQPDDDVQREEAEVNAMLRHLDHPAPRVHADAIAALARRQRFGWGRWAAALLLGFGLGGAAYAAPGSPLPRWVESALATLGATEQTATSSDVASQPAQRGASGVAVAPRQNLVIVFIEPLAESQVTVTLTDIGEVEVRALDGNVSLTSDIDRLLIDTRGASATFQIRIPRDAPRIEIRVGARRVFLKEGTQITTDATASGESYLLPLASHSF
jgi:hypothetical protein